MKKSMKKILGVTLAACMAVSSLTRCSNSPGKQVATPAGEESAIGGSAAQSTTTGDPIKVDVSNMVTGPMAASGIRTRQAITVASEEINTNGGVLGERPLEMVLIDDTGTPTRAVSTVNKILDENVSISIGPHTSPMTSATQELYRKAGVPSILAVISPKLLEAENPYFFRISVSDEAVGSAMVEFAKDKFGAKRVDALYDTDDYDVAAGGATKQYCADNGIECYSEGFTSGDKDLTSRPSKIKGWRLGVVLDFSHDVETALIVRQLDELGMGDIPCAGPDALAQSQTYDLCGTRQLEGTYASTDSYVDESNETMKKFLDDFHTRWGEDVERYAAMCYTAAYLAADAIDRVGSGKLESIRETLSGTKDSNAVFGRLSYSTQGEMNTNLYTLEFDGERNMNVTQQIFLD